MFLRYYDVADQDKKSKDHDKDDDKDRDSDYVVAQTKLPTLSDVAEEDVSMIKQSVSKNAVMTTLPKLPPTNTEKPSPVLSLKEDSVSFNSNITVLRAGMVTAPRLSVSDWHENDIMGQGEATLSSATSSLKSSYKSMVSSVEDPSWLPNAPVIPTNKQFTVANAAINPGKTLSDSSILTSYDQVAPLPKRRLKRPRSRSRSNSPNKSNSSVVIDMDDSPDKPKEKKLDSNGCYSVPAASYVTESTDKQHQTIINIYQNAPHTQAIITLPPDGSKAAAGPMLPSAVITKAPVTVPNLSAIENTKINEKTIERKDNSNKQNLDSLNSLYSEREIECHTIETQKRHVKGNKLNRNDSSEILVDVKSSKPAPTHTDVLVMTAAMSHFDDEHMEKAFRDRHQSRRQQQSSSQTQRKLPLVRIETTLFASLKIFF